MKRLPLIILSLLYFVGVVTLRVVTFSRQPEMQQNKSANLGSRYMNKQQAMCPWIRNTPRNNTSHYITVTPLNQVENAQDASLDEASDNVTLGNVPNRKYTSTFCTGCGTCIFSKNNRQMIEDRIEEAKCNYHARFIPGSSA